ncbi:MAG TPA: lycopene cyclase domain-containing protein [Caldilineaceae bacterium]|nr:lycopene cyclase domain-containing protein [Caldilineaceae bacterium]
MFEQITYLLWLVLCIGIPLLIMLRWHNQLWQQRRALAFAVLGSLGGGWAWDALAVHFDLWYYNAANIAGIWWLGLPLEEWLWIIGVTLLFGSITVIVADRLGVFPEETPSLLSLVHLPVCLSMTFLPSQFSYLFMLIVAALIFHGILWARNAPFLWRNRRIIFTVVAIAEVWMVITDPIGGHWGAWYFTPTKVLGIWFLQVMPLEDFLGAAVVSSAAAAAILVFGYSKRRWI